MKKILNNCPRCSSDKVNSTPWPFQDPCDANKYKRGWECPECGFKGPLGTDNIDAVEKWNSYKLRLSSVKI